MAGIIEDSEYKCTLSEETLEKAKVEIGEDPSSRIIMLKNLRDRIKIIPGLQARTDINFLLPFLRARKFEQERAYQLVKNFYEAKKDREIFDDLKPSRVKHVIDDQLIEVLKERDNNGCRVVVFRLGKWNPDDYPMLELTKAIFLILSKLIQDEETQVHGVHVINNLAGLTWTHARNFSPSFAKRTLNIIQNVLPLRLKRLDYVNEPSFFDKIFSIFKMFMSEKLISRICFNGSSFDKLHTTMNPDYLPTDLGGKVELHSNKTFFEEFFRSDARFEEDNKHGYVNMKLESQKDQNQADAGMQGLGGTFKKLDI